ncbi:MAG: VIT family protein [Gemmatimonadota bacterium]
MATISSGQRISNGNQELVRPALLGLMDGTVSTLAPIFAAAQLTSSVHVFWVGLSAATGAGLSMGLAEALSHGAEEDMTVSAGWKGLTTGSGTTLGGIFHSLPFLIPSTELALIVAYAVVATELVVISAIRWRYLQFPLWRSLALVGGGGTLVFFLGIVLGKIGAGTL